MKLGNYEISAPFFLGNMSIDRYLNEPAGPDDIGNYNHSIVFNGEELHWNSHDEAAVKRLAIYLGCQYSQVGDQFIIHSSEYRLENGGLHYVVEEKRPAPPTQPLGLFDYSYLFKHCECEVLDLNHWDMHEAIILSCMFAHASCLEEVYLDTWELLNVVSVSNMFYGCHHLHRISINNPSLKNLINTSQMFYQCNNLRELYLDNWDVSHLLYSQAMFAECDSLESLEISSWQPNNLECASYMFSKCNRLNEIQVKQWSLPHLEECMGMFNECKSISTLDLQNWGCNKVDSLNHFCAGCSTLEEINLGNFNLKSVAISEAALDSVFQGCYRLKSINLTGTSYLSMHPKCNILKSCHNNSELKILFQYMELLAFINEVDESIGDNIMDSYCDKKSGLVTIPADKLNDLVVERNSLFF